ncbi:MAG TPA: curli production assembly/transport protein CsgE [Pseudomonas sp.]|mgnify:FL=1|nr:curli production assembly/transport protein CsgE [Pseudomonas sp.]
MFRSPLAHQCLLNSGFIVCLGLGLLTGARASSEDELKGFIVDNSISNIGHEFYRFFTERLRDTSRMDFNLVVRERPSARWGSLIWIEYEGRILYRRFLAPNTAELQPTAYEAADFIQEEITRQKIEYLLQDTIDMDKDEL